MAGKCEFTSSMQGRLLSQQKGSDRFALGNQSFLSDTNTILTFQGHPEMNETLAKALLASLPTYMGVEETQLETSKEYMGVVHDGTYVWERILAWVIG